MTPRLFGRPPLEWTPRGHSLAPLWARWHTWRALVLAGWRDGAFLAGAGPLATERTIQRYSAGKRVPTCAGAAFNEPLQIAYEYGLLGVLAMALFCLPILPHLRPGDPWSAAWLIGVVLSLFHWPLRLPTTGLVWLAISAKLVGGG